MHISPELPVFPVLETPPTSAARAACGKAAGQKIAGVCQAFGDYTPIPAWVWRVSFVTLMLCGGIGLVAYIAFWISMPAPVSRA